MKLVDIRVLSGPNIWSIHHKIIQVKLDLEKHEEIPTDRIEGFYSRLVQHLPGLYDHFCSEDRPGGFLSRVKSGTWLGHVVEHVALEIQSLAGMKCNYGKTRNAGARGIYYVVFEYEEERAGRYVAEAAFDFTEAIADSRIYNITNDIEYLKKIVLEDKPGPSTSAILKAASEQNIPAIRLNQGSLFQLGYGKALRRIEATTTDLTSSLAVDLSCDKQKTKEILQKASIPIPDGMIITVENELLPALNRIGFPVVIKPNNQNQGKGVVLNITNYDNALIAFHDALTFSNEILIEKYVTGNDYRLLVVNYKLVAAALRTPAMVEGNDFMTIRELIEKENMHPWRGMNHDNLLTRIKIDEHTEKLLRNQQLTLDHIPSKGKKIWLKQTANLSTGGTSEDVTDMVHPAVITMAERVARIIGLDICGIDYIADDISHSPIESNGSVIEVNAAPGFRMHTNPVKGVPRPVGEAVVDMLFPHKQNGRIPLIAITGTNGKTSTTRLLAHIAKTAGHKTGFTSTDGIYINYDRIESGDCTGPNSARKILTDRSMEFIVLETARGGLLRSGLAFDTCDAAIVTNVAEDHLGLEGIHSIEEMAHVKSVVPETVHRNGFAILNAGDDLTYAMKNRLKCHIALFGIDAKNRRIIDHCKSGGLAAVYKDSHIQIINGNMIVFSEPVENIPITFGGRAGFMIENCLAAILAAFTQNIDNTSILKAVRTFAPSMDQIPGRLNLISFRQFHLIIDYAHNCHGIMALGNLIKQIQASQKTGIVTIPGDRRDIDIFNSGKACGDIFNKIIIRVDKDTRGRKATEIIDILHSGIRSSRNRNITVEIIPGELEAINHAIRNAVQDSLIVHLAEDIQAINDIIMKLQQREREWTYETAEKNKDDYILKIGKNQIYEYTKGNANSIRR